LLFRELLQLIENEGCLPTGFAAAVAFVPYSAGQRIYRQQESLPPQPSSLSTISPQWCIPGRRPTGFRLLNSCLPLIKRITSWSELRKSSANGWDMSEIRVVCFDAFGTLVEITDKRRPLRTLLRGGVKSITAKEVLTRPLSLREVAARVSHKWPRWCRPEQSLPTTRLSWRRSASR
jgi:hypothetical protein